MDNFVTTKILFVLKRYEIANASIMPPQARLCLAIYDFEPQIMLSICLNFQAKAMFKINVAVKCDLF